MRSLAVVMVCLLFLTVSSCGASSPSSRPAGQVLDEAYEKYRTPDKTPRSEDAWKEPLVKAGKAKMFAEVKDRLMWTRDSRQVEFAAEALTVWGVPDRDGAAAILEYLRKPGSMGWAVCRWLRELLTEDQARELAATVLEYPRTSRPALLGVLSELRVLELGEIRQLMLASEPDTSDWWTLLDAANTQLQGDEAMLQWLEGTYAQLKTEQGKSLLVNYARSTKARPWAKDQSCSRVAAWLSATLEDEREAPVRQEILYGLYCLGQRSALKALVKEVERQGVAAGASFASNAYFLKEVKEQYPQSMIARGMAAYEAVRGEPYLGIDRLSKAAERSGFWPYVYGDGQYDPEKEIPGWQKFLTQFPGHPGADDAAYRLGRCLEIKGQWTEALNALYKAMSMPDGDCRDDAAGRIAYILDGEMPLADMESLDRNALEPSLRPLVEYSVAVRKLRQDRFKEAAGALESLVESKRELPALMSYDASGAVLLDRIKGQAAQAARLARLQESLEKAQVAGQVSELAKATYELGAAVFHDELTYYNHLWQGRRAEYRWVNNLESAWHQDLPPNLGQYLMEMINYAHSASLFQRILDMKGATPDIRAKALYSLALSYDAISNWGSETAFLPKDYGVLASETFERFVKEYPDSSMADDAMLAVGVYRQDLDYLRSILGKYPQGDRVSDVERLLKDTSWMQQGLRRPVSSATPLWSNVTGTNLPGEVQAWVDKTINRGDPVTTHTRYGEYTYLLIASGEKPTAGYTIWVKSVEFRDGHLTVTWVEGAPRPGVPVAQVITHPYVVLKVAGRFETVHFLKQEDR